MAADPKFDAAGFVRAADTIYIVAPAHKQRLTAPPGGGDPGPVDPLIRAIELRRRLTAAFVSGRLAA